MRGPTQFLVPAAVLVVGFGIWFLGTFPLLLFARGMAYDRAPTDPAVLMTLERIGCYGTCPGYRIVVFKDGRLEYAGEYYVRELGHARATLGPRELTEIRDAFSEGGFCLLDPKYVRHDATDNPSVITSFSGCDPPLAVEHYHGDTHAPEKLAVLENRLDRILGTDRWVGTDAERELLRPKWQEERRGPPQR